MSQDINADFSAITESVSPEAFNPALHALLQELNNDLQDPAGMTLTALEQYYTEQLDAMEWLGDTATFSGRLYIEVYDSTVEAPAWLQDIMQRYQMQIDEQGEFYDVAGEELMLDDVAIYHDDKGVPTAAFIFDAHSKNGDEGHLIFARVNDIINMEFPHQPVINAATRLCYYRPKLYADIDAALPTESSLDSGAAVLPDLAHAMPRGLAPEHKQYAEQIITDRLQRAGAVYDVHVAGTIYSYDDHGEITAINTDEPLQQARFMGITLHNDGHSYLPYAAFQVPIDSNDTYAIVAVAAGDIVRVDDILTKVNRGLAKEALLLYEIDEGNWKAAIDITAKAHEQLLLPDIKSPYAAEHGAYLLPVPVLRTVQRAFDADNKLSADSLTKRHATELQELTKPLRMSCVMFTDEQGRLFYLDDSEYLEGAFAGLAVIEAERGFERLQSSCRAQHAWIKMAKRIHISNGRPSQCYSRRTVTSLRSGTTKIITKNSI